MGLAVPYIFVVGLMLRHRGEVEIEAIEGELDGAATAAISEVRLIELEQDTEAGVTPFAAYDTGSLPSGGPARSLTTAGAYAEAGIQVLDTGGTNTIGTSAGHIWNNASLHGAMMAHFTRFAERPQFKVWLLHAQRHVQVATRVQPLRFTADGMPDFGLPVRETTAR